MTGTSMASPYVCGVAALMLDISPAAHLGADPRASCARTSAPLAGHDFTWRTDTGFGRDRRRRPASRRPPSYARHAAGARVKLKVFFASDGDCLLLTSADGRPRADRRRAERDVPHADRPVLQQLAGDGEALDLVVVSHIDADHITGILWLLRAGRRLDRLRLPVRRAATRLSRRPKQPGRPRSRRSGTTPGGTSSATWPGPIEALVGQLGDEPRAAAVDLGRPVAATAGRRSTSFQGLAESIPDGVELLRTVDDDTPIVRNAAFERASCCCATRRTSSRSGRPTLTVLGPADEAPRAAARGVAGVARHERRGARRRAAERRRRDARRAGAGARRSARLDFVEARTAEREEGAQPIAALISGARRSSRNDRPVEGHAAEPGVDHAAGRGGRAHAACSPATPPRRSCSTGLKAAGRLDDGTFSVQRAEGPAPRRRSSTSASGSPRRCSADHYVFCADGAHENPDPSVVKTIVETRLATDPRPFTLWFNCSPERTRTNRRAGRCARRSPRPDGGRRRAPRA